MYDIIRHNNTQSSNSIYYDVDYILLERTGKEGVSLYSDVVSDIPIAV